MTPVPSPDNSARGCQFSRRWRLSLTCLSIALNAAAAGGIFTFPLISESKDIGRFRLTQPQVSSIVLAGLVGQYPVAPLVGSAIDNIGPWACSLASAFLFSTGFGLFSLEFQKASEDSSNATSRWVFYRLFIYYFIAGLGTVTSYFSALFSASKNFPKHTGLAAGGSMALFGLSPLILSLFASKWFIYPERGLDVAGFTRFLAVLTGSIHILGALNLRIETQLDEAKLTLSHATHGLEDDTEAPSETMPLLRGKKKKAYDRVWDVLRDYNFWILVLAALLTLGSCEMVVANIGTISLALPLDKVTSGVPQSLSAAAGVSTATMQVRLLSLSNTLSRITTGPMADFVSPVASYLPSGLWVLPHKHRISRVAFLLGACILVTISFLWMTFGVNTQQGIWAFSVGIGIAYGTTFTVLPSLVASIWGTPNLGRNFGLITYAPFMGTTAFSYLYAFIASAATETKDPDGYSEGACVGKQCWRLTFLISAASGLLAASCAVTLWKRWRGLV